MKKVTVWRLCIENSEVTVYAVNTWVRNCEEMDLAMKKKPPGDV